VKRLIVHPGGRYLMWDDGTPFFYLGDTAWELFHRLTRGEIDHYLQVRAGQGFNVIQAVALAEKDGLRTPNAYGRLPLVELDPARPDLGGEYSYWDHVDWAVRRAAELGLFVALLPTWGDKYNLKWGDGPEVFTPQNATAYGEWLGARYRDDWNVIWMLGGDRPLESDLHRAVIDAMGAGLRCGDGGAHLITFHPMGVHSSADEVAGRDYIDFHTVQSGHGVESYDSWRLVRRTGQAEASRSWTPSHATRTIRRAFARTMATCGTTPTCARNAYWDLLRASVATPTATTASGSLTRWRRITGPSAGRRCCTIPARSRCVI
jgi:hypothetical protein